jgi:hypothetical protein
MKRHILRWLIVTHRWTAIGACVLFVMWFVSGLVMMYVGYPKLTARERSESLPGILWERIRIAPDQALELAGAARFPRELRLEMMAAEPVYRIGQVGERPVSISAFDGHIIDRVGAEQAVTIAEAFSGIRGAQLIETIERDQWTVAGTYTWHRPLHRISLRDDAGSELYVSSVTGEVVLDTSRRERVWNWFGSVIHWIYFTELRARPPVWRQVVLWLSGVGIFVAVSGLWLGIERMRLRRRYRGNAITPYRGWMAWHHVVGIAGGVFLLTWIFSGWISMSPPGPWTGDADVSREEEGRAAFAGNTAARTGVSIEAFRAIEGRRVHTVAFTWVGGEPLLVLTDRQNTSNVLDGRTGAPRSLNHEWLFAASRKLMPGARVVSQQRLEAGDSYWYAHHDERKFPVLRVVFDDPNRTWIYIDAATGTVLTSISAADRVNRWTFNALHSLDFRWLIAHRPAWDVVMWAALLAGLLISVSGAVIGWRRLTR